MVIDGRTLTRTARNRTQDTETYLTTLDLTGELRTGPFRHRVLTGLDYYDTERVLGIGARVPYAAIDLFEPVYSGVRPVFWTVTESTSRQDWFGLYFQDQIELLENLHVLGGGRYDWAGSEQSESAAGPAGSAEDRAFSPRVGLVYQPTSWLGLYGSYTESFGAMAQFGRSRTGEAFGPETATQYEAGLKADLLDGSLMATLAFYHLTKQDILTPDPIDRAVFSVQIGAARSTPGPPLRPNGTHSLETEVTLYETHHQDPERHVPVDGHEQAPALPTLPALPDRPGDSARGGTCKASFI